MCIFVDLWKHHQLTQVNQEIAATAVVCRGPAMFQKLGTSNVHHPSLSHLLSSSQGLSKRVWGEQCSAAKQFWYIPRWKNRLQINEKKTTRMLMSRISESNKMSWILQLCSLEANYKSQGWPKLWGVTQPNLNFWVSGHPQWLHHWLYRTPTVAASLVVHLLYSASHDWCTVYVSEPKVSEWVSV